MTDRPPIPTTLDDITPDWLRAAFASEGTALSASALTAMGRKVTKKEGDETIAGVDQAIFGKKAISKNRTNVQSDKPLKINTKPPVQFQLAICTKNGAKKLLLNRSEKIGKENRHMQS